MPSPRLVASVLGVRVLPVDGRVVVHGARRARSRLSTPNSTRNPSMPSISGTGSRLDEIAAGRRSNSERISVGMPAIAVRSDRSPRRSKCWRRTCAYRQGRPRRQLRRSECEGVHAGDARGRSRRPRPRTGPPGNTACRRCPPRSSASPGTQVLGVPDHQHVRVGDHVSEVPGPPPAAPFSHVIADVVRVEIAPPYRPAPGCRSGSSRTSASQVAGS